MDGVGGHVRPLEIAILGLGGGSGRVRLLASVIVEADETGGKNSVTVTVTEMSPGGRPFAADIIAVLATHS
jgi:hypothetical protein